MNTHPNDHIVRSYDEEQHRLGAEIVRMGEMSVAQLEAALDVIERRDESAARRIIAISPSSREKARVAGSRSGSSYGSRGRCLSLFMLSSYRLMPRLRP